MRLYNVHTLKETEKIIQDNFQNFKTMEIAIDDARGMILAEDILSTVNVPDFRRSTVDGYAVIASDTNGATDTMPLLLELIGESQMGLAAKGDIKPGQTMYVPTGGMVPKAATAMVMIEYTEQFSEEVIAVMQQVQPGQSIVGIGDDVTDGAIVLKRGTRLSARHLGALAAIGCLTVTVYKQLKISVISTGDELVTTHQTLQAGQIYDINTHTLKQHAMTLGMEVIATYVLKDDKGLIEKTMRDCIQDSDLVLISGGSSVGYKDYTADLIEDLGQLLVHGLAIKPGKPSIVGRVDEKMVLGLPGHPVSALIVFDQLIRMYLSTMGDFKPVTVNCLLQRNLHAAPGKTTFVMVAVDQKQARPILGKSGLITTMSSADGYIKMTEDCEGLAQGSMVQVHLFE